MIRTRQRSRGSTGGGAGPAPPVPVLRTVVTQNRVFQNQATLTAKDSWCVITEHIIGQDCESIVLNYNGWKSTGAGEVNILDAFTVESAAIIANSTFVPVTWSAGRTKTINPGDNDINSDVALASGVGLAKFAKGSSVYSKIYYSCALGATMPISVRDIRQVATGQQSASFASAATTPSTTDATGLFTFTGVAPVTLSNFPITPIVLGYALNDETSVLGVGDSITEQVGDPSLNPALGATGNGYFQRMMRAATGPADDPISSINFAKSASGHSNFTGTNVRWAEYIKYCTHTLLHLGTNTIGSGCTRTLAQVQSDEVALLAVVATKTSVLPIAVALPPRTASTDAWASAVNQTYLAACWNTTGTGKQFNDWRITLVGTSYLTYFADVGLLDGSDPQKFNSNGAANAFAADNTHPSAGGHEARAVDFRPLVRAL